jgi:hypothetical protein
MAVVAQYAKAITAAIVSGLGAVAAALDDNSLSSQEYVTVAIAFFVALGAVWAIPNAKPTP